MFRKKPSLYVHFRKITIKNVLKCLCKQREYEALALLISKALDLVEPDQMLFDYGMRKLFKRF